MPTAGEYRQFRRLVGDSNSLKLGTSDIDDCLNDATYELTIDFATPLGFDTLLTQYHNEVIYKAAINWWWNNLSELQDRHSIQVPDRKHGI